MDEPELLTITDAIRSVAVAIDRLTQAAALARAYTSAERADAKRAMATLEEMIDRNADERSGFQGVLPRPVVQDLRLAVRVLSRI